MEWGTASSRINASSARGMLRNATHGVIGRAFALAIAAVLPLAVLVSDLAAATPATAETTTVRPVGPDTVTLARDLEILEDPAGTATLADVLGPLRDNFRPAGTDHPVFGLSDGAAWTRVRVDLSEDPFRATRRAQFSALHPDAASFFAVDDTGRLLRAYHGGLDVPGSTTYRKFSVALGDLDAAQFTLYARMTTHHISVLTQFLITAEEETRAEIAAERVLGPMFGAIALALIFCLLLWIHLREPVYGYGFAFVAAVFVTTQAHVNIDRLLWPPFLQRGEVVRVIYYIGSASVHAFGVMLASHFLDIPARRPRLHAAARIAAAAMIAVTLFVLTAAPYGFPPTTVANIAVATVLIVLMLADAARTQPRTALVFGAVSTPIIVCLVLTNSASVNIMAQHPIWVSVAVIGGTYLAVGVTLVLANGFRQNLETKVRERTAALSVANQALREAHEAKNRMLGVVAHDLRNPLGGIRAAAQLLLDIPLEPAKRETLLRTIRDGADVTLGMTEDLLDVAAIREGKVELTPGAINLKSLVESRAELFRMTAQAKEIVLDLDLDAVAPVWADPRRTAQALDNLVSNAVKYSPPRTRVTIALRGGDGRACLGVIDEAGGIPAKDLDIIFEPFERASTRPTAGERSVGLGLAIVKRLVEAQGGEIKVHSVVGRGSRFEMHLPFAAAAREVPSRA